MAAAPSASGAGRPRLRAFESGPPPLFNQGVPARARLAFFSFLAIALVVIDSRIKVLETVRVGLGVVLYPVQQTLLVPGRMADAVGDYFTSVTTLRRENDELRRRQVESAQALLQAQQVGAENERLRKLLGARERIGHGATLGTVLYESRDRFSHKIVLHVGLEDGVRAGNPVPGTLDLRFMAANADVVNGDVAVTSGLDGVYPAGLPVGSVRLVERAAKDQFARIVLDPSAGVENHTHLLVLLVEPAARPAPPPAVEAAPRRAGKR